jgi:hypothetical protein
MSDFLLTMIGPVLFLCFLAGAIFGITEGLHLIIDRARKQRHQNQQAKEDRADAEPPAA